MNNQAIKVLKQTDETTRIGGYGVVYGGRDLDGETFTKETNLRLGYVATKDLYYDHTKNEAIGDTPLGKVVKEQADDIGLWVEAELEKAGAYHDAILALTEKGVIGMSSGTAGHLKRTTEKGIITVWPVVEHSLTVTPAEPRTIGVSQLKSLAIDHPILETLLPEIAQESDGAAVTEPDVKTAGDDGPAKRELSDIGEVTMSDEKKEAPNVVTREELDATAKALGDKLDAVLALVGKRPAEKKAGVIVTADEADRAQKGNPFPTFGHFMMAVKEAGQGVYDKRLHPLKSADPMNEGAFSVAGAMGDAFVGSISAAKAKAYKAAPTGMGESSGPAGGYLVDSQRAPGILSRVYEIGELLSRVAMDPVGPNANGMTYYAEAETSRADGSRRGGVRFYWVAENSAITASAPTFRALELKLRKAAGLVYATDELLADTSALESYIMRVLPEELRFGVEDSIVNGLGTGQPLGILNANCTVSVAKETGQAAATLVAENVIKMWSRLWGRSQRNAVWLINQDVQPQLFQLNLPVGTGGQLVFVPPGGLSATPYGTLFGRPVIVHESCATLGTVGDILLVDPMEYQMIEKGGIESASSIHVRFTQAEQVFRFIYRVDGQPTWNAALTPKNGTNTVSPFISLATRA